MQDEIKIQESSINQKTDKGPYIYDVHMEGGRGSLEICHVFADFIVFKHEIYCSFLRMVGVGRSKNWSLFVNVING